MGIRKNGNEGPMLQIVVRYNPETGGIQMNHPTDALVTMHILALAQKTIAEAAFEARAKANEKRVETAPASLLRRIPDKE